MMLWMLCVSITICCLCISSNAFWNNHLTRRFFRSSLPCSLQKNITIACMALTIVLGQIDFKRIRSCFLKKRKPLVLHDSPTTLRVSLWLWWRRGESNPCPKIHPESFLRAQLILTFPILWAHQQTHKKSSFINAWRNAKLSFVHVHRLVTP